MRPGLTRPSRDSQTRPATYPSPAQHTSYQVREPSSRGALRPLVMRPGLSGQAEASGIGRSGHCFLICWLGTVGYLPHSEEQIPDVRGTERLNNLAKVTQLGSRCWDLNTSQPGMGAWALPLCSAAPWEVFGPVRCLPDCADPMWGKPGAWG